MEKVPGLEGTRKDQPNLLECEIVPVLDQLYRLQSTISPLIDVLAEHNIRVNCILRFGYTLYACPIRSMVEDCLPSICEDDTAEPKVFETADALSGLPRRLAGTKLIVECFL